jgi:hypothetical protein
VWVRVALGLVEVLAVYELGRRAGVWPLGILVVAAIELRGLRFRARRTAGELWSRLPGLLLGTSLVLVVATSPRQVTQLAVAGLFALWLIWRDRQAPDAPVSLAQLLVVQAAMFEAIFLTAAVWQTPGWVILIWVWAAAYLSVYAALKRRGDKAAGVMAATWGVIATEVSWILQLWLVTYTMRGGYVLVPQPALILTAIGYVFGSILWSSRQGSLSRARLAEYLVIGVILVVIVVLDSLLRSTA